MHTSTHPARSDRASTAADPSRARDTSLLRKLLGFDALTCVLLGALLVAATGPVARLTGLSPALLLESGGLLLAFGAFAAWAAWKKATSRIVVMAIVDVNLLWMLASLFLAAIGAHGATSLGRALVVAQGIATGLLAAAEYALWRRASH